MSSTCCCWEFVTHISFLGERDQALRDYEALQMSYADLEEYKKSIEKQLEGADKKLAENTATIQKLNHE